MDITSELYGHHVFQYPAHLREEYIYLCDFDFDILLALLL